MMTSSGELIRDRNSLHGINTFIINRCEGIVYSRCSSSSSSVNDRSLVIVGKLVIVMVVEVAVVVWQLW